MSPATATAAMSVATEVRVANPVPAAKRLEEEAAAMDLTWARLSSSASTAASFAATPEASEGGCDSDEHGSPPFKWFPFAEEDEEEEDEEAARRMGLAARRIAMMPLPGNKRLVARIADNSGDCGCSPHSSSADGDVECGSSTDNLASEDERA
eukprot:TRINITY_DN26073_c0_g2_i1.p1 TRINITY_DN26073_c0_g2~~TRINITY_DN26073_c0_g2_i1.p1  ORF type:complete len:153 (+),score=53.11 TRINITY_DN26073_c0_g2_i1:121-579(+)